MSSAVLSAILEVTPASSQFLSPQIEDQLPSTLIPAPACNRRPERRWRAVPAYVVAQVVGAFFGVAAAHLMFGVPLFSVPLRARSVAAQMFSEFVATFGLLSAIWGVTRRRSDAAPFAVGAYITAAYWFTASTSFANPAVTIARGLSDTFAGIAPTNVAAFICCQLLGAGAALLAARLLWPCVTAEERPR